MKLVEPAIYELLKTLAAGAVYAMRAPQGATGPFIIFQRVDGERWRHINGPTGICQASIQIDCYATDYYESKELATEVEEILDGYANTVYYGDESPQEFVKIGGISLQTDADLFDQTDEPFLFRSSSTYLVTYNQES